MIGDSIRLPSSPTLRADCSLRRINHRTTIEATVAATPTTATQTHWDCTCPVVSAAITPNTGRVSVMSRLHRLVTAMPAVAAATETE